MNGRHHALRTAALVRCATYRKAMWGTTLSLPAELLKHAAVGQWVRRRGLGVDVSGADDLGLAMATGQRPARVAARCDDTGEVEQAVAAGVGRFVVHSGSEAKKLAACADDTQQVLIDLRGRPVAAVSDDLMSVRNIEVVGMQVRLDDTDADSAAHLLRKTIGQMAWLRREYGVILTRACLANYAMAGDHDARTLRRGADVLHSVVDDVCARLRFPRPALVLSLSAAAILGSG